MKKTYTPDQVRELICELNLSNRAFCRSVFLNRGTFSRFMRGQCYLSERVNSNIAALDHMACQKNKMAKNGSILAKIKRILGV